MKHPSNKNQKRTHKENKSDVEIIAKITKYIDLDKWEPIMKMIQNGLLTNLNREILNKNNLFHLACIKGKTEVIKQLIRLKNMKKITLNTSLLNDDGIPGLHLYYKYGGTDVSFFNDNDICFLDINSYGLIVYVLDKIDVLELLIDRLIVMGCLNNLEIPNENGKTHIIHEICKKIVETKNIDDKISKRYVGLLRKLYLELSSPSVAFEGIAVNSHDVVEMLMRLDFDFMIYNVVTKDTPLALAVTKGYLNITLMLLEYTKMKFGTYAVYKMIHNTSSRLFSARPIFIAIDATNYPILRILTEYMIPYLDEYNFKNNKKLQFVLETDDLRNTYLHWILTETNILSSIPNDLLGFFIDHTDLNQENYAGDTPAHLIFRKQIWKNIRGKLIGREIDLLKTDQMGNNCYSYVSQSDRQIFMDLSAQIIVPIDQQISKDKFTKEKIKNILGSNDLSFGSAESEPTGFKTNDKQDDKMEEPKSYGLFGASSMHYMLYLKYLENKYNFFYIPVRTYDERLRDRDQFFFDMTSFPVTETNTTLFFYVKNYLRSYYSYLPHNIFWINTDQYYIDPTLGTILTEHNKNIPDTVQRYIMLKLTIINNKNYSHANSLIYDRKKKEAWHFEPYGTTEITDSAEVDSKIKEFLESIYGKITYYHPEDFLSNLNFQMVDGEEYFHNQKIGDPKGYCLAWSMWFIDIVLGNTDVNVNDLMKNFFSRKSISELISEEEESTVSVESTNYYLDFIRRYAHKLDSEKNKILKSIGVLNYNIYDHILPPIMQERMNDYFKINKIESVDLQENIPIDSDG
jgi:hypothetical protein